MSTCPTCRPVICTTFGDFKIVNPTDVLYKNPAYNLIVQCPNGSTPFYTVPAGTIGFVLNFAIGEPPYPNLTLDCTGGLITVPVPSNTTQAQLVSLIQGMLAQCGNQIALQNACVNATYLNTVQQFEPLCQAGTGQLVYAQVAPPDNGVPAGVSIDSTSTFIVVSAGVITSTVSQADANGKALQLAQEMFNSGQIICNGGN
jgi:hypothetical protein